MTLVLVHRDDHPNLTPSSRPLLHRLRLPLRVQVQVQVLCRWHSSTCHCLPSASSSSRMTAAAAAALLVDPVILSFARHSLPKQILQCDYPIWCSIANFFHVSSYKKLVPQASNVTWTHSRGCVPRLMNKSTIYSYRFVSVAYAVIRARVPNEERQDA